MNNFNGKVFGNPLVTPINTYTKKQTEALVNEKLGDVSTALDTILEQLEDISVEMNEYYFGSAETPTDPNEGGREPLPDFPTDPDDGGFEW